MAVGQTGFGRQGGSDWISGRDEMTTDCGPRWHWEENRAFASNRKQEWTQLIQFYYILLLFNLGA